MRAVRLEDSAQSQSLIEREVPRPQPGKGEVLVQVYAAGVIRTELTWYPTSHQKSGEPRTGAVPCHEFSGLIAGLGEDVQHLEAGQEIFGMNDWYASGALAEYCTAPLSAVAPKPRRLSHAEAASVPISGLTAWQGLFDHAKLRPGERVLVHGGAGGVGMFAVQLAKGHGARVIATASRQNREFVQELGAEQVIDYQNSRFEEHARDMDVVIDTIGGETLERSWSILSPRGRIVTVVSTAAGSMDPRVQKSFFIVEPNRNQLKQLADLIDSGRLRTEVDAVVPLSRAADAFEGRIERHGRGKIVVSVVRTNAVEK